MIRSKVNKRRDKVYFKATAARTHKKNIPGGIVTRGGTRL